MKAKKVSHSQVFGAIYSLNSCNISQLPITNCMMIEYGKAKSLSNLLPLSTHFLIKLIHILIIILNLMIRRKRYSSQQFVFSSHHEYLLVDAEEEYSGIRNPQ